MRAPDTAASLTAEQAASADAGMKAMIPIDRPFLDYVLSALADAGFSEVCIVIGPEHAAIRQHYTPATLTRLHVGFRIQPEPRGTADGLLAAADFVAGGSAVVLNADNYYPARTL